MCINTYTTTHTHTHTYMHTCIHPCKQACVKYFQRSTLFQFTEHALESKRWQRAVLHPIFITVLLFFLFLSLLLFFSSVVLCCFVFVAEQWWLRTLCAAHLCLASSGVRRESQILHICGCWKLSVDWTWSARQQVLLPTEPSPSPNRNQPACPRIPKHPLGWQRTAVGKSEALVCIAHVPRITLYPMRFKPVTSIVPLPGFSHKIKSCSLL